MQKHTKSPALVASGAGVLLFGIAAGVGAGFMTFWATTSHACSDRGCDSPPLELLGIAIPMQALSLSGIVGGIAMMSVGARQVPVLGPPVAACTTTDECGPLHCIDGVCRSLEPARETNEKPSSVSGAVMFGDGRGYVTASVVTDLCALLTTVPPWMVAYAADFSRFATGFQLAPLVQLAAGPALHLFKGRMGPAMISFLGWGAVAATTYFVPTVVSTYGDQPNGLAAGTAMLLAGGTVMTIVDAVLARPHTTSVPETSWAPSVQPVPGGAFAAIGGSW